MKLILVRHGQTDLNRQKRLTGRSEESLNKDGLSQVQDIIPELEKVNFDMIFSSPLLRARQTAEIIANYFKMNVIIDDRIVERDFGLLSGKTWDEAKEYSKNKDLKEDDMQQRYDYRPYEGESIEDVKKRYSNFIQEMKNKHYNKTILVVAHGGILRLSHNLFGKGLTKIENASIHEFEF
jgi:broad specificity phosphatase PhoE